ncbi:MAG: carboxypeptidase-like regulatory domain-containing protein, partial [Rikenellaceae bacterium]
MTLNCGVSYAQNNITGKVTSLNDGSSIIGATVMLEGSTRGTVTDIDGNFQMSVPATGTLRVSYLGYQEQAIELQSSQTNYIVELAEQTEQIEDVVVVGYGTMRKKEVTGAVARLTSDDISNFVTSDVGSALQGQIAGVNVQSSSGQPGASANIQIRGISSINGSNDPLYVVDGVPYDGDPGLSPSEIESLDV